MKQLNTNLIKWQQTRKFIATQDITDKLGISLDDYYTFLRLGKMPEDKVKMLCEILHIKESEIYIN